MKKKGDALSVILRMLAEPGYDPVRAMLKEEIARGYVPVPVGSVDWLPTADWHPRDVVSSDGVEVRIVAIAARNPGTGAFRRLIAGIEAAGMRPVVVCPLTDMEEIMRHWGWATVRIGGEVQCRPPAQTWPHIIGPGKVMAKVHPGLEARGAASDAAGSTTLGTPPTRASEAAGARSGDFEERETP